MKIQKKHKSLLASGKIEELTNGKQSVFHENTVIEDSIEQKPQLVGGKIIKRSIQKKSGFQLAMKTSDDEKPEMVTVENKNLAMMVKPILVKSSTMENSTMENSGQNNCSKVFEVAPGWTGDELLELLQKIGSQTPEPDTAKCKSRSQFLDWSSISVAGHNSEECKSTWFAILEKIPVNKTLNDLLEDSIKLLEDSTVAGAAAPQESRKRVAGAAAPQESRKRVAGAAAPPQESRKLVAGAAAPQESRKRKIKPPNLPKHPLQPIDIFFHEKKEKVLEKCPDIDKAQLNVQITASYKSLPEDKKQKYISMAAQAMEEYEEKLKIFYQNHPEFAPPGEKKK